MLYVPPDVRCLDKKSAEPRIDDDFDAGAAGNRAAKNCAWKLRDVSLLKERVIAVTTNVAIVRVVRCIVDTDRSTLRNELVVRPVSNLPVSKLV